MIETHDLSRSFGQFVAVDRLNLTVTAGELFGFLGVNGAGKTTTMQMMVGLLQPSAGTARIAGYDIQSHPLDAKHQLGYMAQNPFLYEKLTGREFLHFVGGLHRIPNAEIEDRVGDWFALLDLSDKADQLIGSYSGGMARKIALCAALLHRPAVLILDEPLTGLDPISARRVKDILRRMADDGTTVFISTHTLEIAERICDRVGIIDHGRLIAEGTFAELRGESDATLEDLFITLTADETLAGVVDAL